MGRVFSAASKERLETCDPRLQLLFDEVLAGRDCAILCGHRGEAAQREAFASGRSKLDWPLSKHNRVPSLAVDVQPWYGSGEALVPSTWDLICFGGYVLGVAFALGFSIRWGGDWDGDHRWNVQAFNDLYHFELTEK